jgi:hypothetical protein
VRISNTATTRYEDEALEEVEGEANTLCREETQRTPQGMHQVLFTQSSYQKSTYQRYVHVLHAKYCGKTEEDCGLRTGLDTSNRARNAQDVLTYS